jgi:hypothetical protein
MKYIYLKNAVKFISKYWDDPSVVLNILMRSWMVAVSLFQGWKTWCPYLLQLKGGSEIELFEEKLKGRHRLDMFTIGAVRMGVRAQGRPFLSIYL